VAAPATWFKSVAKHSVTRKPWPPAIAPAPINTPAAAQHSLLCSASATVPATIVQTSCEETQVAVAAMMAEVNFMMAEMFCFVRISTLCMDEDVL